MQWTFCQQVWEIQLFPYKIARVASVISLWYARGWWSLESRGCGWVQGLQLSSGVIAKRFMAYGSGSRVSNVQRAFAEGFENQGFNVRGSKCRVWLDTNEHIQHRAIFSTAPFGAEYAHVYLVNPQPSTLNPEPLNFKPPLSFGDKILVLEESATRFCVRVYENVDSSETIAKSSSPAGDI